MDEVATCAVRPARTLLVVDDEGTVRRLIALVLEQEGYRVLEAGDGEQALLAAAAANPLVDLLITDLQLPRKCGLELARELQARHPRMKVLFISGFTTVRDENGGTADADAVLLQKPFSPDELVRKVKEMLESVA